MLRHFHFSSNLVNLVQLGNYGGFSGAALFRVETANNSMCLKAMPAKAADLPKLIEIHNWMIQAKKIGLSYVPAVVAASNGQTAVNQNGKLWELVQWMPGQADFHQQPSKQRLEAACLALAQLHEAWAAQSISAKNCPAVLRRLESWKKWTGLQHRNKTPRADDPVLAGILQRGRHLVDQHVDQLSGMLTPWMDRSVIIQPCLCDIWHDHMLFMGDRVSGVVDYSSMKMDHVAVDLARLLGSLVGDNTELRQAGMQAYCRVRILSLEEESLINILDRSGTLLALCNWIRWLCYDVRQFEDLRSVCKRLEWIVKRVELWND